jgi:hypothetical protein
VTEYAWRVKFAMKPPKDPVKFSDNATVKSEVEVRPYSMFEMNTLALLM